MTITANHYQWGGLPEAREDAFSRRVRPNIRKRTSLVFVHNVDVPMADRSSFRRVTYRNDDTCTNFELILSHLRCNPNVAIRVSALHAFRGRQWSYRRAIGDGVLCDLAYTCPNIRVLEMYVFLCPSAAPLFLAPKFSNVINLFLFVNNEKIICDIPPALLLLQHMPCLEYLRMCVHGDAFKSPEGVHVSGHGYSRDLPFRLKSYQVDVPFLGWLDPLLVSVDTIRDIDLTLSAWGRDMDEEGIRDTQDAFARCGRTVRTLKLRVKGWMSSTGEPLYPFELHSILYSCPRLQHLEVDSRGTEDDKMLWQTLRALSRPLSHFVVHFHLEDPHGARQHIRHEQQQYLETMFPCLLRMPTLRHLRTLTVLQHLSVLRLNDPYVVILRNYCVDHRIVFDLQVGS